MKQLFYLLALSFNFFIPTSGSVLGQSIDKQAQIKRMSQTVIQDMETVRSNPNIELKTQSLQIAKAFFNKNIYPTTDAFLLIYNLNPGYWPFGPPLEHELVLPDFPRLSDSQQVQLKHNYDLLRKPDSRLNERFNKQSKEFDEALRNLPRELLSTRGFYDSLRVLDKEILPHLNKSSDRICKVQMESYLADLNYITGKLDSMSTVRKADELDLRVISEMVNGFFVTSGYKKRPDNYGLLESQTWEIYHTTVSLPSENRQFAEMEDKWEAEVDLSKPANAAIYVYRVNPDGTQNPQPEMDQFDVYYGSNGFKYSLKKPGCDTLSYFNFHPVNRASTLPVVLGSGSYCIVLKDKKTGRLYMRSDISLANEKIYDKSNLLILPFTIDK